jgi:iron(III) transport system permease protein
MMFAPLLRYGALLPVLALALLPFGALLMAWLEPLQQTEAAASAPWGEYSYGSLRLVAAVLAISVPIGAGCAWLTATHEFPLRRWLDLGLTLPLALPAYILAIVYGQTFSSSGPIQTFIRQHWHLNFGEYWFPSIRSPGGAAFVLAMALYPYVYLVCRAALSEQNASLSDAARMLGQSSGQIFRRVTLPLLRPAMVAGAALIAMETLADFGVVSLYATPTFTTGIYRTMFGLGDPLLAQRMAGMLVLFVLVALAIEKRQRSRRQYHSQQTSGRIQARQRLSGVRAFTATVLCLLPCLLGFLLPVGILLTWSLVQTQFWQDALTWQAAWHSLTVGVSVAALVSLFALGMAYQLRARPNRVMHAAIRLASSGYALPGIVIAVSIMLPLIAFDRRLSLFVRDMLGESYGLLITGSIGAITLACTLRFLSLGLHTLEAGMQGLSPSLDMAARSLGASEMAVIRRIHWPLLRSSLAVSALVVFVDTVKELPATYLLRPFNYDTLAIRTFALASDEKYQQAAPAALMLIAAGTLAMLVLQRYAGAPQHYRRMGERA